MRNLISKCALVLILSSAVIAADSDIRLNSLGFLTDMPKKASICSECSEFVVKKAADNSIALSGEVTGPVHQNDINQDVWTADFSEIVQPGKYYIEVPEVGKSYEFEIGDKVYDFAYYTAMKAFYLWRCGCEVEGEHNGITYAHEACHLDDGYNDYRGIDDNSRSDGTKGWHDAGDFGKYTVNAGVTVGCLFMAWDHFGDTLKNISLDIPDTAPDYPDFLKELKWEIDWLFSMQYPDGSGRVSHKLTRLDFSAFMMPENDDEKRYYTGWGSAATADFVAMMAMAARYFEPYDAEYAKKCLDAAKVSYKFLQENPQNVAPSQSAFSTGAYGTTDTDDRLWAAAEMWETTGDANCLKDLEARISAPPATRGFGGFGGFGRRGNTPAGPALKVDEDWDWGNVKNLGMFTYALSEREGRDPELLKTVRNDVVAAADGIVTKANADVYGRTLGTKYYWGCNGGLGRQALNLNIADKIQHKEEYKHAMLDIVGQLFGRNSYGRSFVTGLGHNPPMHPHDRRSGADDIEAPWPGYVVGGGQNATNWIDDQESYQTNEIAINWQAGLVYALAAFASGE